MRLVYYLFSFVLFVATFVGSVKLHDSYRESWLTEQVKLIRLDMSKDEVIQILGKPTSSHISDIPGVYWCYGSDSFNTYEEYCGKVSLEMSRYGRVASILPTIP